MEWEGVGELPGSRVIYRSAVPSGWLVAMVHECGYEKSAYYAQTPEALTFVPDPERWWRIKQVDTP